MSTTNQLLSLAEAVHAAKTFRAMFPDETYERWEVAGSVRRRKGEVSDVEHVVIPRVVDRAGDNLFGETRRVNLLFEHLDKMVATLAVIKHQYANGVRWGGVHRGVDHGFMGTIVMHELFCANADNWGPTLAIRTGPADFSRQLVTGLLRRGHRNKDGKVWRCVPCAERDEKCPKCQGTGLEPVETVSVPTEEAYFKMAGVPFVPPEQRR